MITLREIIQATPPAIKRRAGNQCYGTPARAPRKVPMDEDGGYHISDGNGSYKEFRYRVRCTTGFRHTTVRFFGPLNVASKVWCFCDCEYFKFHCEVALAHAGSSSVVQSNGQRPRFTNPSLEKRCCKHVYLLFALALRSKEHEKPASEKQKPEPVKLPALPVNLPPFKK